MIKYVADNPKQRYSYRKSGISGCGRTSMQRGGRTCRRISLHVHIATLAIMTLLVVAPATGDPASPIRIGASLSFEGKYAEPSEMIRIGYEMWIDKVNASGGLLGRPVEMILYDDQSDPDG